MIIVLLFTFYLAEQIFIVLVFGFEVFMFHF